MRTRAQAADPTALDLPYLSTTYDIPEADLQILLDAPTAHLVGDFLASLTTKAYEFDALHADKLKVDVELENHVRTAESKVKAQKASVTRQAKEIEELRAKLSEADGARDAIARELEQLKMATAGSTAETTSLRHRIETLESSNRDALALVESKSTDKDRIATELSEQHAKLIALRRELSQVEEKNQTLENAAASQKFKEQSLQQEIDLLKRNNEWHSTELQTRTTEHAKFRKERNARIATLQRELEDGTASVEALKRTESSLRQRLDEVQAKADEAFTKIASLQEDAARREQAARTETDSTRRLAELQAQSAASTKARLQDVQAQLEQIENDAREEIGTLQAEIETERSDKEDAERKVADLELTVEKLEAQRPARGSAPGTPSRNGSPSAMMSSMRKSVNGLSFTQLYSNFTTVQADLEAERRRTQNLSSQMDELIAEVEARSPEILELKAEQDRLEQAVQDFSRMLEDAHTARDLAVKESSHWQGETQSAVHESEVRGQQLRDLSAQVKILLVELQSREQGLPDLSAAERLDLERAARGELSDEDLEAMTFTDRLISERLVIFRTVAELQEQNSRLLRLDRELGQRMEGEEAQAKARQSEQWMQENEELKGKNARLNEELKSTVTQIASYVKERDMFRRMLQQRGQLRGSQNEAQAVESLFGTSTMGPPATPQKGLGASTSTMAMTPRTKEVEDVHALLRNQQQFFDDFRAESSTDRTQLKSQADTLAREKSALQADVARAQSQLQLAGERYEMLKSNYNALRTENQELARRGRELAEQAAGMEVRVQGVAEEIVEASQISEGLRGQVARAEAEREVRKRGEDRLAEEVEGLRSERSRLNKLVGELQGLLNERDLQSSEERRKTQARVEVLEADLRAARAALDAETEVRRKEQSRREYEESMSRTRQDDLVKSLSHAREELVQVKTSRDALQTRVEELELALEKATALAPRPTPAQQHPTNDDEEDATPNLAVELIELRRDLELARQEFDAAKAQVEQYKSIAQTSEEELAGFNETSELFKESMEREIAGRDERVKELEGRVERLEAEVVGLKGEVEEAKKEAENMAEAKREGEAEVERLKDDAERFSEEKKLYREDLRAQAEIARQAQQSYEDELVKHADAAKSLQSVRREYHDLRTSVAGLKAEAEAAKLALEAGEESWGLQREGFEREIAEMRRRRGDVEKQNRVLHEQMEGFSRELKSLREGRRGAAEEGGSVGASGGDSLQEVIAFLRREKEIVDVQYELSLQEAKRLTQQLDCATTQLEASRASLAEERRAATAKAAEEGGTTRLQATLQELNLYRESATTLRNEVRVSRERLEAKAQEVENLVAEIEPLKVRVGDLKGELEAKEGEMELLAKDREHWRERTRNIISKYDRVDPAELEALKESLETLKREKEGLEAQKEGWEAEAGPLRERVEGLQGEVVTAVEAAKVEVVKPWEERIERFKNQSKEQNRKQTDRIRVLGVELEGVKNELLTVRAELESTKAELETSRVSVVEAEARAEQAVAAKDAAASSEKKGEDEEGEVSEESEELVQLRAKVAEADGNAEVIETLQARAQELEHQIAELHEQLEKAHSASQEASVQPNGTEDVELTRMREEIATLRANQSATLTAAAATVAQPVAGGGEDAATDQLETQHALALKQMEEEHARKIDAHKSALRRQLTDQKEKWMAEAREELIATHAEEVRKLREEFEGAVGRLRDEHAAEVERLKSAAAVQKAEESAVKPEPAVDAPPLGDLTDAQANDLLKNNERAKTVLRNSIRKAVTRETEGLTKTLAEKEAEIAELKASATSVTSAGSDDNEVEATTALNAQIATLTLERDELLAKLATAQTEKEAAVRHNTETIEKKVKLQLSQRDLAQAKLSVVSKAATETPERAVKEVWEEAKMAKPAVKAAATATTPVVKPVAALPSSELSGAETLSPVKLASVGAAAAVPAPSFGKPSAPPSQPATVAPSFGQPSQSAPSLAQAPRRPSAAPASSTGGPNPQATAFTPNGPRPNPGTGPAALRGLAAASSSNAQPPQAPGGGSKLPTPGGVAIQGAARGGGQQASGLPRGGAFGRGRGGGRGSGGGAGQKRPFEGGEGGGDGKRMRGGGGAGGA